MSREPSTHPSYIHLEPMPAGLKGRCVKAARARSMTLVQWAVKTLQQEVLLSEMEPPTAETIQMESQCCNRNDKNGFLCTLMKGHTGDHIATNQAGNEISRWPQEKEAICC